jgi:hypothetical protein
LLNTNHISELEKLLKQYDDDGSTICLYTQALLAFRANGEHPTSKRALNAALKSNPYVPDYLLGKKRIPNQLPFYISLGDDSEAVGYAANHLNYWRQTPGATKWLEKELKTTKVKRKPTRHRNKFKVGDSVKVKPGINDPDFGGDISNWQGRIIDIEENDKNTSLLIKWDSYTLQSIPSKQIEHCEEDGLDWSEMYIYTNEVIPADQRDTIEEQLEVFDRLSIQYKWSHLGEQGRRIQSLLEKSDTKDTTGEIELWQAHLNRQLKIPFEAIVSESEESSPLRVGNKVKVVNIQKVDELYGILAKVTRAKNHYYIPLCDLETVSNRSKNYQLLNDYTTWFVIR